MTSSIFFSAPFLLFTLAFISTLILALTETLGTSLKFSPSAWVEARLPRFVVYILKRLHANQFPIFILTILFLLSTGVFGYLLQFICYAITDAFASLWMIIIPVLLISLLFTVFLGHWLSQLMYSDRTMPVIGQPELLGRIATICRGDARPGFSAQARVRDQQGHLHYVEVEPEFGELELNSEIILVSKQKHLYMAKTLPKDNHLLDQ